MMNRQREAAEAIEAIWVRYASSLRTGDVDSWLSLWTG